MKTKQTQGFTLIEVIIVVGIVGVLSAISIGFYGNHVVSANRTEARAALTSTAASLEKCRALYGAYDNASCNVTLPFDTEEDLYTISSVPAASAFTLTATPVAGKRQTGDSDCTTLTLTNTGLQSGTGADITKCW